MKWWHEQWRKDTPFGIPYLLFLIAAPLAVTLVPLVVIAVAISTIVSVERWFGGFAVITGWLIQLRLLPLAFARFPTWVGAVIEVGTGGAWVISAFVAGYLLGPVPALVVLIPALAITLSAIGKGQASVVDRRMHADRDASADPQQRFELVRARVRETMVLMWHVDEADVDHLLDAWDAEAAIRGLDRFDWRYWSESNAWLRKEAGVSDDV